MVQQMDYKTEAELEKELSPENLAKIPDMWAKDREEYQKKQQAEQQVKKSAAEESENTW